MRDFWQTLSNASTSATAAVGSLLQSIGASAPSLASAASSVATVAGGPAHLMQNVAAVEKPMSAAAKALSSSPFITGAAHFLSKALPITAVVSSSVKGAQIVQRSGYDALINTRGGRDASLGAVGGALFLLPAPPVQIAAAGVLGVEAANHFGALDFLNEPAGVTAARTAPPTALRTAVLHAPTPPKP